MRIPRAEPGESGIESGEVREFRPHSTGIFLRVSVQPFRRPVPGKKDEAGAGSCSFCLARNGILHLPPASVLTVFVHNGNDVRVTFIVDVA